MTLLITMLNTQWSLELALESCHSEMTLVYSLLKYFNRRNGIIS